VTAKFDISSQTRLQRAGLLFCLCSCDPHNLHRRTLWLNRGRIAPAYARRPVENSMKLYLLQQRERNSWRVSTGVEQRPGWLRSHVATRMNVTYIDEATDRQWDSQSIQKCGRRTISGLYVRGRSATVSYEMDIASRIPWMKLTQAGRHYAISMRKRYWGWCNLTDDRHEWSRQRHERRRGGIELIRCSWSQLAMCSNPGKHWIC